MVSAWMHRSTTRDTWIGEPETCSGMGYQPQKMSGRAFQQKVSKTELISLKFLILISWFHWGWVATDVPCPSCDIRFVCYGEKQPESRLKVTHGFHRWHSCVQRQGKTRLEVQNERGHSLATFSGRFWCWFGNVQKPCYAATPKTYAGCRFENENRFGRVPPFVHTHPTVACGGNLSGQEVSLLLMLGGTFIPPWIELISSRFLLVIIPYFGRAPLCPAYSDGIMKLTHDLYPWCIDLMVPMSYGYTDYTHAFDIMNHRDAGKLLALTEVSIQREAQQLSIQSRHWRIPGWPCPWDMVRHGHKWQPKKRHDHATFLGQRWYVYSVSYYSTLDISTCSR